MKRLALLSIWLSLPLALAGCKTAATAPPLAPGYLNQADETMGQALAGAEAFYQKIQLQSATGVVVLSPGEKKVLNDLGTAINQADPLYLAYHNGQGTQAAVQQAIDQVTAQQAAVKAVIPGVQP
jgi:hypothetical protein